jgi:signal peptidase II
MSNAPEARGQWRWLLATVATLIVDQWTKRLIESHFKLYETWTLLPVFDLVRAHNRGMAFSVLDSQSGWQRWMFSGLATVVSVALLVWLARLSRRAHLLAAALSLILAGALGNLVDRLRLGYVIDFIQVHWQQHYFPAFNVADSAITVGAALLLLDSWLAGRKRA